MLVSFVLYCAERSGVAISSLDTVATQDVASSATTVVAVKSESELPEIDTVDRLGYADVKLMVESASTMILKFPELT